MECMPKPSKRMVSAHVNNDIEKVANSHGHNGQLKGEPCMFLFSAFSVLFLYFLYLFLYMVIM